MLIYSVTASAPSAADVVERRLTVEVSGQEAVSTTHPGEETNLGEIAVPQDSTARLSLVDVDDAGNVSEPAVFEFTAVDTIPPAAPGQFGVTLVREE
jgi:hypothetical protein